MDRPDFTHAEWFDKSFKYQDDMPSIYGRYEKPKYDKKGNLLEKGRISITSNYRGEIKDMADANFYKESIASTLGVPVDHIDAYLFGANDKIKSQMGYGLKDQLAIKFQPEDEGRTYTDKQMASKFIGKIAAENPELTKNLTIKFGDNDIVSGEITSDSPNIALFYNGEYFGGISYSLNKENPSIARIQFSKIDSAMRGEGYGNLMYSELMERFRSMGVRMVTGTISDEKGRPITIRRKVVDEINKKSGFPLTEVNQGNIDETRHVRTFLDPKAWYQPDETKIGTQSSNVKLLLEGMASGRILRTSSYKGLGLEDSLLIAHTPDTAKIGQVTAGDKALADLQGGIFYAIANGKKIWASNFAGEGETNILVQFAKDQLEKNPNKKTYILLVKPSTGDNSKIFASVDGARGVSSIFKHLNDSKVMTDLKYINALKNSAKMHLKMTGLEGLGKEELYARIDDALLNSKKNGIGFKERANFTREIATQFNKSGAFDSKKSKKALMDSFHQGFERGFSKVEMERVFGNLMAEDIIKDVPAGHVYGALEITSSLKESPSSNHRGYDASIEQESGEPAKLIMFDKTDHVINLVNRKDGDAIPYHDEAKGSYMSYTGATFLIKR